VIRSQFLSTVLRLLACAFLFATIAESQVTTYKYDNSRSGQNTQEFVLTPANVNSNQFGKLFTTAVDGYVYAQPLYLPNVNVNGSSHNVLYVATEHDSLYAIDADTGSVLWQHSFINPAAGITSVTQGTACTDLIPEIGITSTPAIDTTTGTIYLLTKTQENGKYVQRLHAIDTAGAFEKFGGPVVIQATVPGTGDGSVGGQVSFDPLKQHNRPGLLLENGHVILAWASHCDNGPYHGWVMSYNAGTLAQEAVFNTSPNSGLGGIWMSGDGVAADISGYLYLATGNGKYDGVTEFGDTLLKLGPPSGGSFPIVDWFTPYNQNNMMLGDGDLGSGGLLLLPDALGTTHPQQLVQMGKAGNLYELDRNNLGKYCSSCTTIETLIPEEVPSATKGVWGSPAFWNGSIYWGGGRDASSGGGGDFLKAFSFNANGNGLVSTQPTSMSSRQFNFGTGSPIVSANNNTEGIVWLTDNSAFASPCCQTLYAYDATNLDNMLYNSGQADDRRDVPGGAVKFSAPMVANGKVYVGSQYAVSAYGLLTNNSAPVATIASSMNPITYGQSVTLTAGVTSTQSGTPTGSITFADNNQPLAAVGLSSGQALYTTSNLSAGIHALSAEYSGDANFGPSTLTVLAQTVRQATSSTAPTSSQNPSFVGQAVQFTANLVGQHGGTATGTVTFKHGTTILAAVPVVGNSATYSETLTTPGNYGVVAVYSGDVNLKTSSGALSQVVQQYPTSVQLTSTPNPSVYSQTVTVTATVTSANPAGAKGTLTFRNGAAVIGTASIVGGSAILKTTKLPTGSNLLTASYGGDTADAKSTSSSETQVVNQVTTNLQLKSSTTTNGSGIRLTATLTTNGSIPTGQPVTFASNGTSLGTANLNSVGVASLITTSLPSGLNTITATYAGNANYSSASASIDQEIK
jgi:Bacterial Ig-like domain (group 3)/PQQ-like domain